MEKIVKKGLFSSWRPLINIIKKYFHTYGGWTEIIRSPFLHLAILISSISYSNWLNITWLKDVSSVLPNLLGISISIYAIIFSLIDKDLKSALMQSNYENNHSKLSSVNATFFHFILVQCIALIWSIIFQGTLLYDLINLFSFPFTDIIFLLFNKIGSFIGYTLFIYSLLLVVAAAISVYRLANIGNRTPKKVYSSTSKNTN